MTITPEQFDAIRSYVADSGVVVDYVTGEINKAASLVDDAILSGSSMPDLRLLDFTSDQAQAIIDAVNFVIYPPIQSSKKNPLYDALDVILAKQIQPYFDAIEVANPGLSSQDKMQLYKEWFSQRVLQ